MRYTTRQARNELFHMFTPLKMHVQVEHPLRFNAFYSCFPFLDTVIALVAKVIRSLNRAPGLQLLYQFLGNKAEKAGATTSDADPQGSQSLSALVF